jgi:DNA-binding CsgD family transcriptional regulator
MADEGFTPMERRMVRMARAGLDQSEIAHRFRKSPGFVRRVMALSKVPRHTDGERADGDHLRPLERRVLKWRAGGASLADVAARFRRSPRSIQQIERLANYKQDREVS